MANVSYGTDAPSKAQSPGAPPKTPDLYPWMRLHGGGDTPPREPPSAQDQYRVLKGIGKMVSTIGWITVILSGFALFLAIDSDYPQYVVLGSVIGALVGFIIVAYGQLLACLAQIGRDVGDIKASGKSLPA